MTIRSADDVEGVIAFVAAQTSDVILRASAAGEITYISPTVRRYGYEPEDLIGGAIGILVHPDDAPSLNANNRALLRGEIDPSLYREHRYRTADGDWVWLEGNPHLVFDDKGQVVEIVNIFRDVTRRKQLEAAAQAEAEQFGTAFRDAPIGMSLVGLDGAFLRINEAFCRMVGYSEAELLALDFQSITHPADLDADLKQLAQLISGEIASYRLDKRYIRKDGVEVWAQLSVSLVRGPDGEPRHLVSQVQDLTERRAAEEALRISEARYRLLAEASEDVTVQLDLQGGITYVSPAARMYGYEPDDLVGRAMSELLHADDLEQVRANFALAAVGGVATPQQRLVRIRSAAGEWVWMEGNPRAVRNERGEATGIVTTLRNVTERREQGALFEAAFENAAMGKTMVDMGGYILRVNAAACRMMGYARDEFQALHLDALIHPEEYGNDDSRAAQLVAGEIDSYESVRRYRKASGDYVWVRMTVGLVRHADGRAKHFIAELQDLTERHAAEMALKASEARYRLIADSITDVIMEIGADQRITYVSPSVSFLGYQPEELIGTPLHAWVHPEDRTTFEGAAAARETVTPISTDAQQFRLRTASGAWAWMEGAPRTVTDDAGRSVTVTTLRNVTQRREQEALFETAFQRAALGRSIVELDGRTLRANQAVCRILGYTEEEITGLESKDLLHPDDVGASGEQSERLMAGEIESYDSDRRLKRADGVYVWVRMTVALVRFADGTPKHFVIELEDLTERHAAEAALKASEERYRLIAENTSDMIIMTDLSGKATYVSQAVRQAGYRPEDIEGRSFAESVHPDDLPRLSTAFQSLAKGGKHERVRWRGRDLVSGGWVWLESNPSLVRDPVSGEVTGFLDVIRNVQPQVEQEEALNKATTALQQSEARYRLIGENTSDIIVMAQANGRIDYISPSVSSIGYTPEDLIGTAFVKQMHPEDLALVWPALKDLPPGATAPRMRWRAQHKITKDWVWLESQPTMLKDPETGGPAGFLDVVRDVTRQVEQEEALAQARAEAEAAAAAKSQFLANMSHEIRTPLTAVLGFTSLLAELPELPAAAEGYVDRIAGAGKGLLAIVNDILDFSKLEAGKFEIRPRPTDVAALCEETLLMFANQAEAKGLTLSFELGEGLPKTAMLDGDRLRQTLINLIGNGIKFTETGGVTLAVAPSARDEIRIEVRDTGPGLDAEAQARLFQRFSQIDSSMTRRHGGTGLGLAICKGVAEAMGGEIGVASTPGEGAVFHMLLPAPAVDAPQEHARDDAPLTIDGTRVFLVDDNATNRELARRILEAAGAEVHEAGDGVEAVERLAVLPVDVVLMDLRMPRLDGRGALARLRVEPGPNQGVPVLAFTADADLAGEHDLDGFDGLVRKPLQPLEMYATIAAVTQWLPDDENMSYAAH
ncbi:MAG: PAS domain S-box protein [Phenylobacterium sp.]|uniref:PAS domain-containing hybrid sensor histidine kinase/response regulator n=1 Tax=Phenylobacterium sp. TaxID=1871053 RepID=UPI0012206695|nr:PAS domain S-box protein [Phenylobacterium sp.]TAL28516.1 MAG: PAS domain S-box protein [Phenylobacterium sp.]